ncbi:hypothetical protein Avbf_01787 [Armadillidium vulgare]|nr:hypothetical protein Avbf_01787 [Armadillidium vulgare]
MSSFINGKNSTGHAKKPISNTKLKWLRKRKRQRKKQKRKMNSQEKDDENMKEVHMYPFSNDPLTVAERHRLKREKRTGRMDADDKKAQMALEYLEMWQNDRSNWKFRKNLDIFLQKYCLHPKRIPKSHFKIILDYFSSGNGKSLNVLKDSAEKMLLNAGKEEEDEGFKIFSNEEPKKLLSTLRINTHSELPIVF